uniref:Putative squamosa promoter-binding-like protein 16 n=1 Tax=Davidia involucrata TaxID=16924 RepID=A0A5B6YPD9_DAVIN
MLGRFGELGDKSVDTIADPKVFVMESSGSSKRAKAPGNIAQAVSCSVDGCNSDLSQCREYHRRHKVCELHSKTPKVTIGGREQRFCQQCSRFHSLGEFDEGKRSCRKRLDGHNRRRRKLQSESVSRNTGRFLSNQQGTPLLSFSSPQIFPSVVVSSSWAGAVKAENVAGSSAHTHGYSGRRSQFQILQGGTNTLLPNSASGNNCISDELNQVVDSDCALSLLSSVPPETREIGLSHMVQPDPTLTPAQPLIHNMQYSSLGQYPCLQGVESANLQCQGLMFQNVPDGSSPTSTESHQQMFSFMWE